MAGQGVHGGGVCGRGDMRGGRGACVVGGCMPCTPLTNTTRYGDTVNERAVRILLECILVS